MSVRSRKWPSVADKTGAERHHAALVLFGRAVVTTLTMVSVALGFLAGVHASRAQYDPYAYATGVGALFAAACAFIAYLLYRRRVRADTIGSLEERIDDLTDRNWELREAEERARSLLEAQGDLIVRRDVTGRITYANDAYCALAGKERLELIGLAEPLIVLEQTGAGVLADGTRVHDQHISGVAGVRWIAWREVTVRSDSGTEVQSVGRDVTDRVEAERALADAREKAETANRAKSRFLAMISHEIRTPLNGMLGMAGLLLDTPLTPEQTTYAKAAKTSGETLLSLIEEILDFSKIEAGRLDLDARPFVLNALVEDAAELLAPRAQAKGIEIASFVDERLAENVIGDAARLRQVLLNLAGNAIKFTERGGISIVVEPGAQPDEVKFLVRDTGIGIKPDDQLRIFSDFEQADGSSTRKFGGTGLGLAISRRIVERMEGRIAVDSKAGAGATFTFAVKLPAALDTPNQFTAPDLAGVAVLIVASARIEASLLARRLMHWGARVSIVPNEKSALVLLAERGWNVVLIDYAIARALADANGVAAFTASRRIVLLAPADRHDLPALKDAGFTGYLVKPVRAASLAARLRNGDAFERTAAETEAEINLPTTGTGLSILVAEDNEINALLARALLSRLGHRPVTASNGEAAVESWLAARAAGAPYDLVLMDVHMPGVDGLEATRRMRAIESETKAARTRIVALTANAYAEDRDACLEAGMDDLLIKPLDRDRLAEALDAIPKLSTLAA
ncbi:MAG: ATP-binding protein [Pseudolabrys sp.]